ncbi:MAG: V-type ATP synthase subunit D [Candidatus Bathyarchaeota archaeon]|nr:V-type ATP synthase subunit D [Candidatus Bathyarchaeota archaeon]
MSVAGRAAVSRGILLRLREQLEFTKKGQELLKMKRDHLASETNKLLSKVAERNELDRRLMQAYESLKAAYLSLGYTGLQSQAAAVDKMEIRVRPRSIMGVMVPEVLIEKKANTNSVSSSSASQAAVELNNLMEDLIKLVEAESRLESIAHELMMTNRKVNSLERVMIPGLLELISYVEGRLEEESLDEFFRAKLVKQVIRRGKK